MGTKATSPSTACRARSGAYTFGNLLAERILQQAVRQSPINIRPLIGIKPLDSTKGRGMMAWGYLLLHRSYRRCRLLDESRRMPALARYSSIAEVREAQLGEFLRFLEPRWCVPQGRQHHRLDEPDRAGIPRGLRAVTGPVVSRYRVERVRLDYVAAAGADRSWRLPQLFRTRSGIDP